MQSTKNDMANVSTVLLSVCTNRRHWRGMRTLRRRMDMLQIFVAEVHECVAASGSATSGNISIDVRLSKCSKLVVQG